MGSSIGSMLSPAVYGLGQQHGLSLNEVSQGQVLTVNKFDSPFLYFFQVNLSMSLVKGVLQFFVRLYVVLLPSQRTACSRWRTAPRTVRENK